MADTMETAGKIWNFGTSLFFTAAFANLRPAQARLIGLTDRQVVLIAQTSTLPLTPPTKGDHIQLSGVDYRIARHDPSFAADKTLYVLSLP